MRRFLIAVIPLVLALPLAAQQQDTSTPPAQQQNTPPASAAPAKKPPNPPQKKPSTAEENPFPLSQSEAAAHQTQPADNNATPAAPTPQSDASQPSAPNPKPSAADDNPFPESQAEKAAGQNAGQDQKSNPAAPGSATPPGYSSSQTGMKGFDIPQDSGPALQDSGSSADYDSHLAKKDAQVGTFYLQTHDYQGAYDRFNEATHADPGNADAVFGLAEAARRLNHRDEALRNYRLYLSALPSGPRAKEARKALKEMGADPNS
jgi:tetratricopeptide (TPR) repeat protein